MFVEGEVPYVANNGYNNGSMMDGNGWWTIILFALIFGWGRGGYGFGGNNGGSEGFGWQLGKLATQEDVASGFTTNTILGVQRDQTLAMQNGFSSVQQTLCQGFNGINTAILQSANATERGFAQMGYNMADCCCSIKSAIADVKYANEKQTADLIVNANANTQRILDYLCAEKINTITAENVALKGQISNYNQTNAIVSALKAPTPVPAYNVPNPFCCYNGCTGIQ